MLSKTRRTKQQCLMKLPHHLRRVLVVWIWSWHMVCSRVMRPQQATASKPTYNRCWAHLNPRMCNLTFLVRRGARAGLMPRRGHRQPVDLDLMAALGFLPARRGGNGSPGDVPGQTPRLLVFTGYHALHLYRFPVKFSEEWSESVSRTVRTRFLCEVNRYRAVVRDLSTAAQTCWNSNVCLNMCLCLKFGAWTAAGRNIAVSFCRWDPAQSSGKWLSKSNNLIKL